MGTICEANTVVKCVHSGTHNTFIISREHHQVPLRGNIELHRLVCNEYWLCAHTPYYVIVLLLLKVFSSIDHGDLVLVAKMVLVDALRLCDEPGNEEAVEGILDEIIQSTEGLGASCCRRVCREIQDVGSRVSASAGAGGSAGSYHCRGAFWARTHVARCNQRAAGNNPDSARTAGSGRDFFVKWRYSSSEEGSSGGAMIRKGRRRR